MKYRFYKIDDGQKRYLRDDCESYTVDRKLAGVFSEAAYNQWGYEEFQREPIGEDERMKLVGAPMLPGLESER